ncbi:MAG: T9SS type A sorting domain-containing protein [Sphingobacteriaceae bacterium]|jgi:hypothetical protein
MAFLRTCFLIVAYCIALSGYAQMQTLNSTSLSLCTCPGHPWNISAPNKPSILFPDTGNTNRVMFSKYGFTIPQDAFIEGIEVSFNYTTNALPNTISDKNVLLLYWGNQGGNDKASATPFYTGSNTVTLGGPNDLWGWFFTPADINSDGFGFNIKLHSSAAGKQFAFTNGVQITVHFINPNGIKESQTALPFSKIAIQNKQVSFIYDTTEEMEISIYNLNGQIIFTQKLEADADKTIDMGIYENGLYTYTLKSQTQFQKGKLYLSN